MEQPRSKAARASQRSRAAVILAAGPSSRMGSPKALLPWAGTSLVGYAIRELRTAGASTIVIVLGADAEQVRATLSDGDGISMVDNPNYATGRSSSVRVGAAALPENTGAVIVQSVDQPCPAAILEQLYETIVLSGADLAIPVQGGWRGHPLCVAGRLRAELAGVQEEERGLRAVVQRHADAIVEVAVDSDVIHLNLNDPAAYEAAYRAERWR